MQPGLRTELDTDCVSPLLPQTESLCLESPGQHLLLGSWLLGIRDSQRRLATVMDFQGPACVRCSLWTSQICQGPCVSFLGLLQQNDHKFGGLK